ncbi:MAG: ATP-binding protein [Pseudanabaenaceae cyanobacterium bins.68]|nr:ATP-binding protein [Pseudanabaenaceae cyanobacterium bins.68]
MFSFDPCQCLGFYASRAVPTCGLLQSIAEALAILRFHWQHGAPSSPPYLVVLSDHGLPLGLFRAECMLAGEMQSLEEVTLLPLPAISQDLTVAEFLQRICEYEHFAELWTLVDQKGRYCGVLEVLPLLRGMVARQLDQAMPAGAIAQLVRLIEQFPSPIVVYSSGGEILGMNQMWRDWIRIEELNAIASFEQPTAEPLFCTSDGVEHTWQIFRVALQAEWQGLGVAIAQDITAQRRLAIELADQNADLIRLNRLKDEFLACISHELKTPLTTIMGMTNLLNNPKVGNLSPDQKRYLQMVYRSSQNLSGVVDNIVDTAKAETGQLQISPRTLDIRTVSDRAIQQVQNQFQSDIPLCLEIEPHVTTLVADEKRLQQMLVNLLSNGIKFSEGLPQEQTICLRVSNWEGWIAFSVSDRGIGIPEDKQHLLFQKFQQLESVRTRRFDGTGLGLVLTRHLARLHGGDVTFVSQAGLGSEFTILLPPHTPQSRGHELEVEMPLNNRLVLIVETVPQDLEQMSQILSQWGYRIVVARTGTEALEKARRLQPCLILLSPNLPSLSGWDVLALLKQDPATSKIRAIMALQSLTENWEWNKYPADGFFLKPIQPSNLSIFLPRHHPPLKSLKILTIGKVLAPEIGQPLQHLAHHLLEAEDAEQAEFLAKIWHPDLILLSQDLGQHLEQIQAKPQLTKLPILAFSQHFSEQKASLESRFPTLRLMIVPPMAEFTNVKANRLLERAIRGMQAPTILLLDLTGTHVLNQSLQNYLLMAGMQVFVLDQPALLQQQLASYSADALLVSLHDRQALSAIEQEAIRILMQIPDLPPLIILDGRTSPQSSSLIDQLFQLSTSVLQQPHAIAELISTLQQSISL